ncbi:glycoside hydrolase family 2 TIM barrel-domain containing protein [Actinocorallia populi]|uniref:glycoside hydrolase family 2 TIM barrel-domain containing protein n=1 Tax=Actinocorallia populi TaxID=2079200 RepID=UPI000D08BE67|nr:glycoside hydrolase family 2 TIM barrel-domain containing protein [Actinocorallia populi]
MIRTPLADWEFRPKANRFLEMGGRAQPFKKVTLPHDAMLEGVRTPEAGGAGGFFPGGVYEYRTTFDAPEAHRGKQVLLHFEGVYRDAMVYLNGAFAGQCPNGYGEFTVPADAFLRYGEANEIRVECRAHQDSRWYSGAGLHRPVHLVVGGPVRVAFEGVRVSTPDVDAERAVVEIATIVENTDPTTSTVEALTEIRDPAGTVVACDTTTVTVLPGEPATVRQRLYVRRPALWSVETPHLYTATVTLAGLDSEQTSFGIRTLRLDPEHGLRINGETVKLRGACVHHDNGVLGAAAIARAEERRIELLKAAGFNAVRASHNPLSRAMLEACDRLGMLVMDEAFDMWTAVKSDFDYALSFPKWWEHDIEAMVGKDFNHPSVIFYSIGNEIPEAATPHGAARARRIAEKVRSLDPTRFVTNATNATFGVMQEAMKIARERVRESAETMGVNTMMAVMGDVLHELGTSELVTEQTRELFSALDVAGMNYLDVRYEADRELFPNRIIVGSETHPTRIDTLWRLVTGNSHVIGDFTWTGWDYLGEAGIGRIGYADEDSGGQGIAGPFPWLTARTGDLDITGHRRAPSYYREIVFGLRTEPYLAVHRPDDHGRKTVAGPWSWPDVVSSWSWGDREGAPVQVDVYSAADEVELLLDGEPLGRAPAGPEHRYRAVFDTLYRPGELVAVAYAGGVETGRTRLASATGPVVLSAEADRPKITASPGDLAFVSITLTDAAGALHHLADRAVTVAVEGPGTLAGLGSARPATEETFTRGTHTTYDGRALAVVRPTGPGEIQLTVSAPECENASLTVEVSHD